MAQEIRLEGRYMGENVFLQNPIHLAYGLFCVDEVQVNGETTLRAPHVSALEIRLNHVPLRQPVEIYVKHKLGCLPRILNAEALKQEDQVKFLTLYVHDQQLMWQLRGEESVSHYYIEYLNGDVWEEEGVIASRFDSAYTYAPTTFSAGVNKFRVRYESRTYVRYSTDVEILLEEKVITFTPKVVTDKITLSEDAAFEILDAHQNLLLQGRAQYIPLRRLAPGDYFIVLHDILYPFTKR